MKCKKTKLQYKLLLVLVPVSIGSLIIATLISFYFTNRTFDKYVPNTSIQTAEIISLKVSGFMNNAKNILSNMGNIVIREDSDIQKSYIMKKVLTSNSSFNYIYLINESGMEIADTNLTNEKKKHEIREYHKEAFSGKESFSRAYMAEDGVPFVEVCVPLLKWRKNVGVICGEIDFRTIWNILDNTTIGESGYSVLITQDGQYLSHPDKTRILRNERITDKEMSRLTEGRGGFFYSDNENKKVLIAYSNVPELGWITIVIQDAAEILRDYDLMKKYTIFSIFCLVLLIAVIVIILSRIITRPIEHLTHATEAIAAGNLNHEIKIETSDEIGSLAGSFNLMVRELKRSQKLLIQSEKLSSIGKFAASIAHEIQNPIAGLLGYAQLLKKNPPIEKVTDFASDMEEELQHIQKTTERLLSLSRQTELKFEEQNLNLIVERCANLLEHYLSRFRKIELKIELDEKLPIMKGDKTYLQQAVMNLLLNSSESIMDKGFIQVSTWHEDRKVFLQVKDNGIGIDEDNLEIVFEPFYSKKVSKEGTGLGLYITNEIVKLHNGIIEVKSKKDVETSFTLIFDV